jgi:hypothetical protein
LSLRLIEKRNRREMHNPPPSIDLKFGGTKQKKRKEKSVLPETVAREYMEMGQRTGMEAERRKRGRIGTNHSGGRCEGIIKKLEIVEENIKT